MGLHDAVSEAVNSKYRREKLQPLANPQPPVFIIIAGVAILTTQERSPHAPIHGVDDLDFTRINRFTPSRPRHGTNSQIDGYTATIKQPSVIDLQSEVKFLGVPF
jgi:hypothetical protein